MTAHALTLADRLRVAAAVGGHLTFQGDPDDLRRLARAIDYCNTAWAAAESNSQRGLQSGSRGIWIVRASSPPGATC